MVILKGNKITIGKISVRLTNPFWRNTKSILVNVLKHISFFLENYIFCKKLNAFHSFGIAKGKVPFSNPNTTVSWMFENRVIVSGNNHEINTSCKLIYMVTKAFFVYYRSALWNARTATNVQYTGMWESSPELQVLSWHLLSAALNIYFSVSFNLKWATFLFE